MTERFNSVFARRSAGVPANADSQGPLTNQNDPTNFIFIPSESGFYSALLPATEGMNTAGLASHGTRILVKFSPLAAGMNLFAPVRVDITQIAGQQPVTGKLRMVNTWSTGASGSLFTPTAQTSTIGGGIAPLAGCPSACQAVYEVLDSVPFVTERPGSRSTPPSPQPPRP